MSSDRIVCDDHPLAPTWSILVLTFLATASAHGCLVLYYGTPLPFWDEWDGIGLKLFLPYLHHNLPVYSLFAPHNEHRILLTRLQSLALLKIFGRWDLFAETAVNCIWYGLSATALVAVQLRSGYSAIMRWGPIISVIVFSLPFGWQNALWGFQSQNYFTLLFAMLAILAADGDDLRTGQWWGGMIACLLSLFSTGAGILTSVSIFAVHFTLCGLKYLPWRKALPTLVATAAICGLGLFLRVDVPGHEYLKAKTLASFLRVFASCLAWPGIDLALTSIIMYLPLLLFCLIAVKERRFSLNALRLVWIPALFSLLNAAAIAYARGNGLPDDAPLSRYQEMLAMGAIANACALMLIKPVSETPKRWNSWRLLCVVWCTLLLLGAVRLSMANFGTHLPFKAAATKSETSLLSAYAFSRDVSLFEGRSLFEIGHTDTGVIKRVIDNPDLAPVLPTILQLGAEPTFLESGLHRILRSSPLTFLFSFTLLLLVQFFGHRRGKKNSRFQIP